MLSEREILRNPFLGPPYREGIEKRIAKGQLKIIARMLERRFGAVSPVVQKQLKALNSERLTELSVRLSDAKSLDEHLAQ